MYKKSRISEDDRAKHFFAAAKFFQDDVFTKIADLETSSILIQADLYAHKHCMRCYERKYERALKNINKTDELPKINTKKILFDRAVSSIDHLLQEGNCCTLS